jgi:hypothetical protein
MSVTRIYQHEPSRHLFLTIADAALAMADAENGEQFLESLFRLDRQFHPNGANFDYFIPFDDRLKHDLNGHFVFDAKFFLPKHLAPEVNFIRKLYYDLIAACGAHGSRYSPGVSIREDVLRYTPLGLKIGEKTKDRIRLAVSVIRDYFLKVHVLTQ